MNYKNPEADKLYERLSVMENSPERNEIVRQMQQTVVDDLPCVLTVHRVVFLLHYDWLHNYKPHVFGYGLGKYRNVDAELRRERVGR
jgi:ABC-type transport system substrate-binding protein